MVYDSNAVLKLQFSECAFGLIEVLLVKDANLFARNRYKCNDFNLLLAETISFALIF